MQNKTEQFILYGKKKSSKKASIKTTKKGSKKL